MSFPGKQAILKSLFPLELRQKLNSSFFSLPPKEGSLFSVCRDATPLPSFLEDRKVPLPGDVLASLHK